MMRFERNEYSPRPLAPFVMPSDQAYERSLKRMNALTGEAADYIRSLDEATESALQKYDAPFLQYVMVPESITAVLRRLADVRRGPIRSPLILGYTAGVDGISYAIVATYRRTDGSGSGEPVETFVRKRSGKDFEGYDPEAREWRKLQDAAAIYNLTRNGPAGRELVNGLCDFFDADIFHLDAREASGLLLEYGDLLNLCDMLRGAGKIQMMVLETDGKAMVKDAHGQYFPILVAYDDRMCGCAVAVKDGKFHLMQYREAFRFSRDMTVIWGDDSFVGNGGFTNTVYVSDEKNEIAPILKAMWTRKPEDGFYRIFPLSNRMFAEISGTEVRISSFGQKGDMTEDERRNIGIGLSLLRDGRPVRNAPEC